MSKVEIFTDKTGRGSIIVDGVEIKEVTSYSVEHSAGKLAKVNIRIVPIMVMDTHQDAIVEYDFVVDPLPTDVLLKLQKKVNEELNKRGEIL